MMTTSSRRDFLHIAGAGSALAASGVFSAGALAAPADMPQADLRQADMPQGGDGRYVRPVKFGLGGVPFGNEFEVVSDEDAYKTLEAAWNAGVRYYVVSPWYGLGLGERRYGNFLHNKNRDSLVFEGGQAAQGVSAQRRQVEFPVLTISQQRCVRLHGRWRASFDRGQPATPRTAMSDPGEAGPRKPLDRGATA